MDAALTAEAFEIWWLKRMDHQAVQHAEALAAALEDAKGREEEMRFRLQESNDRLRR